MHSADVVGISSQINLQRQRAAPMGGFYLSSFRCVAGHIMTEEIRARHLAQRQEGISTIILEAERFKLCTQCLSIAFKRARICPICRAYRFTEDRTMIEITAGIIAKHPFPLTRGTVPRI